MMLIPAAAAASLAYSMANTDLSRLPDLLQVKPGFLMLAVGLALLPWLTATLRLCNWARFLGHDLSRSDCFRVVLAGELGAAVSPTALGSAPVRVATLAAHGLPAGHAASLVGLGSLEDGIFVAVALPTSLALTGSWRVLLEFRPVWPDIPEWFLPVALVVALCLALLLPRQKAAGWGQVLRSRWLDFWTEVHETAVLIGRRGAATLAVNLLLTCFHWTARFTIIAALVAGLGLPCDPLRLAVTQWICFTAMTLFPTPGAAGGAEASFLFFFGPMLPVKTIALVMFLWRFLTFYFLVAVAFVIFTGGRRWLPAGK